MAETGDGPGGYGKPPSSSRFRKGHSGNPRGRPRGRKNVPPYEEVLGQTVIIREDGQERRVSAAEAFLLHVTKRGLEGDSASARAAMTAIEEAKATSVDDPEPLTVITFALDTGGVSAPLESLRMARKLDRYRDTARMALEPWIVEMALARLGERRLTAEEQRTVYCATRMPWKVRWPHWWTECAAISRAPAEGDEAGRSGS